MIELFAEKKDCCGCGACMNICPKTAIHMEKDEYGFVYPKIDTEKCVECGACKKVCAFQNEPTRKQPQRVYAIASKNNDLVKKSASGGLFATMAVQVLEQGGCVYGAVMQHEEHELHIRHVCCETKRNSILSVFEQLVGAGNLSAKEKSILDRCAADVYRDYIRSGYTGEVPTLKDMYRQLMLQPEEEARGLALSSELFINGSLNTFAQPTNVNKKNRIMDYDIRELGEQLMPLGMLVTLDSIFNRVIQNWKEGKTTWIFADEFYLLFRYEYSANFFYRLYKRIRKYNGFVTGLTQNVEELLKSDTARLMLANSEFLILLNQASTDREELAALLNISENQLSYITNVSVGSGLIRCSGNIVPFENTFPKNTDLYKLMTTKPGES